LLILGPSEGQNSALGSFTKASGSTGGVTFRAEGLVPTTLAIGGGDDQMARFNQILAEPLSALVRAADGRPVPGYPVDWAVTSGNGSLSNSASLSDATGAAQAGLTVGSTPDTTTVEASATGLTGSPLEFKAAATAPITVTVTMQNLSFIAPGGGDAVTILLGDTVRWLNRDGADHTATSSSTPPGGNAFDSPVLNLNDTFDFVPNTRGTWIYFCRVHPDIMRDATLTVN
jgi:plastocyanin